MSWICQSQSASTYNIVHKLVVIFNVIVMCAYQDNATSDVSLAQTHTDLS